MVLLALDRVRKRYRRASREVVALDGVSLQLFEGDMFGVLGGARSGKTTLLRVAAGIEPADEGKVWFLGREVTRMSRRERRTMLRSELGCIWRPSRYPRRLPVIDNVALPLIGAGWARPTAVSRAHEMLRRVAAEECAEAHLLELSTSELTRVSIAQALIREPRLVLADEPTETLNMVEREEILSILRSLTVEAGIGILVTAGDASGVMRTNRLASLTGGRLLVPDSDAGDVVELDRRRGRTNLRR